MNASIGRISLLLLLLAAACNAGTPFAFIPGETLELVVIEQGREQRTTTLRLNDKRYSQITRWLEDHQSGWFPYLATTPSFGTFVSGADLRLQFLGAGVLLCPRTEACLYRSIDESEYEFLRTSTTPP